MSPHTNHHMNYVCTTTTRDYAYCKWIGLVVVFYKCQKNAQVTHEPPSPLKSGRMKTFIHDLETREFFMKIDQQDACKEAFNPKTLLFSVVDEFIPAKTPFNLFLDGHPQPNLVHTKYLVEQLDGSIHVESTLRKGTAFIVTIPVQKPPEDYFLQNKQLFLH